MVIVFLVYVVKLKVKFVLVLVVVVDFELVYNFGLVGEQQLQVVVDCFNKEVGSMLKLVWFEKGDKLVGLNLFCCYDLGDVLSQLKQFILFYVMMVKVGQLLKVGELLNDLKVGVVDVKGKLVVLLIFYLMFVLFYNKNVFCKVWLDLEQLLKIWFEMQGMFDKLQDVGYVCLYILFWLVWVYIDNVSVVFGVLVMSDKGLMIFNGLLQVKYIVMMVIWSKVGYFYFFGWCDEVSVKFYEGECVMIIIDLCEYVYFCDVKGVELGVVVLFYYDDVYGGWQSLLVDGVLLWIGVGCLVVEYKQVVKFVFFLLLLEM